MLDEVLNPHRRKCRMCGAVVSNDNALCKKCLHRRRNFKTLIKWVESAMGYPKEEELIDDITIAS